MKRLSELIDRRADQIAQHYGLDRARVRAVLAMCARTPKGTLLPEETTVEPGSSTVIYLPDLAEAVRYAEPERALRFFEEEGPEAILRRLAMRQAWRNPRENLFRISELALIAAGQLSYLGQNREHLIATGYPQKIVVSESSWIARLLVNLYPTKRPARDIAYFDDRGGARLEYVWVAEPGDVSWKEDRPFVARRTGDRIQVMPAIPCIYEEAPLLEGLASGDAHRLVELRSRVLSVKLACFGLAAETARSERAEGLWSRFQDVLCETLSSDDIEFLLRMDLRYTGFDIVTGRDEHKIVVVEPGGLTETFQLVGIYEQAISSRLMEPVRNHLDAHGLIRTDAQGNVSLQFRSYFDLIDKPAKIGFDRAVDAYWAASSQCEVYLSSFRDRIRGLLHDDRGVAPLSETHLSQTDSDNRETASKNVFRRVPEGSWTINFAGSQIHPQHSIGLQYIAELLRRPHEAIPAVELIASVKGEPGLPSAMSAEQLADEGLSVRSQNRPVDDPDVAETMRRIKREIARIAQQLEKAKESGDLDKQEKLDRELGEYGQYLSSQVGRGGRQRPAGTTIEKARQSVNFSVNRAKKMLRELHPRLGEHFDAFVKAGYLCHYKPRPPVTWET